MLTPIDIQGKVFKTGMGYSKADVDSFCEPLVADYEALFKENLGLKDKINTLNEGLNHYKNIEKAMQKALVLAETTSEETLASAKANATVIEQEAVLKAQAIVADAKIELEQLHTKTVEILQKYEYYKSQYKALAQAQIEMLNSEAFKIDVTTLDAFISLENSANANAAELTAKPQYQPAAPMMENEAQEDKAEEDFDETLSSEEDIMIRDFGDIFESEETSENK